MVKTTYFTVLCVFLIVFLKSTHKNFAKNFYTFSSKRKQPPGVFYERRFLTNLTKSKRKQLCQGLLLKIREQVFPSEFWETFQNTFFTE